MDNLFLDNKLYNNPVISPYTPNSNAIGIAISIGGIVNNKLLNKGVTKPTRNPYFQPKTNPPINIGKCIGNRLTPRLWILPVIKGSNSPSAINRPDRVIFLAVLFNISPPRIYYTLFLYFEHKMLKRSV